MYTINVPYTVVPWETFLFVSMNVHMYWKYFLVDNM